jgi:hypothetical protein
MSELVGIIAIISYLTLASQDFLDMIKWQMKKGTDIIKLREFFDTTPVIQ